MNTPDLDRLIDLAESADADLSREVRSEPSLCAQDRRFGGSPGPTLRRLFMPLALPTCQSDALQQFLLGGGWFRRMKDERGRMRPAASVLEDGSGHLEAPLYSERSN